MSRPDSHPLWKSVLRQTGRDPTWLGYWLLRHRKHEQLTTPALARLLELSVEDLILLCLCRTPAQDRLREDLAVVCERTGASADTLARILRQEQMLARWSQQKPGQEGWLMAAADAEDDLLEENDSDHETP